MRVPKAPPPRPWRRVALISAAAVVALGFWAARARQADDPDRLWKQAETDFLAGRYDRTEPALARLARLRAPTPLDWLLKGQLAMARGRGDEALDDLARVPDGHPMAPQARLLAGQFELRRRRARKAERLLREAVRLDPGLVQAHRELVYINGILLRRKELDAEFRALSRLAPMTFDNVFHWCLTRNTAWDPKEMVDLLRQWVAADPEDRWSRLALAENLRVVGRRDDADSVLAALPDSDPDARAVRVRLALDRGDDRAAESLLAGGPPDHPALARMRGRLALAHRDGPAAVKHFRAAYAAEPDDRDTVFGLGQALAMAGDPAGAAPYQAAARDLDALGSLVQRAATPEGRNNPALMRSLGAACEKARRFPEARAWYSLAIHANPLDTESQKALFRLKSREPTAGPVDAPSPRG